MRLGLHQSCEIHYPAGFLHDNVCDDLQEWKVWEFAMCLKNLFLDNSTPKDENKSASKLWNPSEKHSSE